MRRKNRREIPHIQVDAFPLVDHHFSGVGHYTLGIVSGFDELAREGKLTYSLITPRKQGHILHQYGFKNYTKIIESPFPNRITRAFMRFHMPFPVDVFTGRGHYYFPSFLAWPLWFNDAAVVIHDVTYLAVPECVHKGNREFLRHVMPFSLKNADNIIAVSEFSKSEIVKYYDVDPEKISVAYPSIDRRRFYRRSQEEIHKVKAKHDIFSDNYILSIGNIEPRKNYDRLIDAYMNLPRELTDKYPLVIVGGGGWNNDHILGKMQEAKENGYKVLHPKQFVPDEDIPALYSGATCYVFTPIYEGFGMSPLEAYACGTPVIASNITSVPESAGDAAEYVDPYDVDDITHKLTNTLRHIETEPRDYDEAMEARLESLGWRVSAEITASALTGLPREQFQTDQGEA